AIKKRAEGLHLAAVVAAGSVAEVPFRLDMPVPPEPVFGKRLIVEARTNGFLRHDDDGLLESLILQLVERDEHEGAALARGGRGFDEQVLLAPLFICTLLHRPHT